MHPLHRLLPPAFFLLCITLVGIFGYIYIEHISLLDSIYMVAMTLSTVGFREVAQLSDTGVMLTIFVIVFGIGTLFYTVGQLIEIMVEGQIVGYRRRKKMEKRIAEMKNHYIIAGFGRVGHQIAADLERRKQSYVVLDAKPESAEELAPKDIPHIIGNISSEKVLESADIKEAKVLMACADSDADNVLAILSARMMNPDIYIVARASSENMESKLKLAGANRVITPYSIAGHRMASMALSPAVVDYLDMVSHGHNLQLTIREFEVKAHTKIAASTLSESKIRENTGAMVLAIRSADGAFNLQPKGNTKVEVSDVLIALGSEEQLGNLQKYLK